MRHPAPIVILGMQRSGTSALAGALARLGVFFGPEELLYASDSNNRQGYFEHRKVTLLNLKILDEFQMHVTSFGSLPENWQEMPQGLELRRILKGVLQDDYAGQGRWAIKQPLISLLLPVYNDVFGELGIVPHYVVCVRNPLESMESESRLIFGSGYRSMQSLGNMAIGSWLRYTLGSVCESAPYSVSVLLYDDLIADPRKVLEQVVISQPDWEPSEEQWSNAISSIRNNLRHNRRSVAELDAFPAIVRQTYDAASEAVQTQDSHARDLALDRLRELYLEFKMWVGMLGDPPAAPGKLGLSWIHGGKQRISESSFLVQNQWQTVSVEVDAAPNTSVSGLIYGLPARIWIRRCVWTPSEGVAEATMKCGPGSQIAQSNGVLRLDAAYEPQQIRLITPESIGPYRLDIEFLLETGPSIHLASAARIANRLEQCASAVKVLSDRGR